ncbi:MAG: aminotransferase class V-fold PLP-dependent enzyme [Rhodothermales bacterium]|nr:aminotransferase class V-fold PLP-dependent enzyme [Rhodothermales bacterium]
MPFDVARARRETPGCFEVLHFNNAGAALMPQPVLGAVFDHLRLEARLGGYEAAAAMRAEIDATYDALARLLGCHRSEVAVVENATRAWDMAFYALPLRTGDRILTGRAAYASNYIAFLQRARQTGATVEVIEDDAEGQIDVAALEQRIDERVRLIALTHVPTNGGLVNPAAEVGRVARAAGIPFLLDACQSAGQLPLDVDALGADMLSATSRKFLRGPRGVGFLYVRRAWIERLEPPFLDLHAAEWTAPDAYRIRPDARRFENWESNLAGTLGLKAAVEYALDWGLGAIAARVQALAATLRERLESVAGVTVHDAGRVRCGIVTFSAQARGAEAIQEALRRRRIHVSVSDPSSTLLDAAARGLPPMVRASVHYYNTDDEIERFVAALQAVLD